MRWLYQLICSTLLRKNIRLWLRAKARPRAFFCFFGTFFLHFRDCRTKSFVEIYASFLYKLNKKQKHSVKTAKSSKKPHFLSKYNLPHRIFSHFDLGFLRILGKNYLLSLILPFFAACSTDNYYLQRIYLRTKRTVF